MSRPTDLHAGTLLRQWRSVRRLSQLDVSSRTGVSTRHLSCVETGRAKPSRELLLYLADEFEMPKRAVNDMLLAGGFAPVFSEYSLDDDALAAARDVIRLVLDGNDPNPTTVIDTRWNVVDANTAAFWFTAGVDPALLTQQLNVARLSLHPDGLASRVTNFDEYAGQLLRHMRHVLVLTQDDELRALIDECETYAPTAARTMPTAPDVVLPLRILIDGVELSFLSTVTTFGTAQDVTLSELSIETLYPADQTTREILAARPWIDRASDLSAAV
jgi:transcriptional regulator with XRE-family HTH domain